jgi:hypothetical protein
VLAVAEIVKSVVDPAVGVVVITVPVAPATEQFPRFAVLQDTPVQIR